MRDRGAWDAPAAWASAELPAAVVQASPYSARPVLVPGNEPRAAVLLLSFEMSVSIVPPEADVSAGLYAGPDYVDADYFE